MGSHFLAVPRVTRGSSGVWVWWWSRVATTTMVTLDAERFPPWQEARQAGSQALGDSRSVCHSAIGAVKSVRIGAEAEGGKGVPLLGGE